MGDWKMVDNLQSSEFYWFSDDGNRVIEPRVATRGCFGRSVFSDLASMSTFRAKPH